MPSLFRKGKVLFRNLNSYYFLLLKVRLKLVKLIAFLEEGNNNYLNVLDTILIPV